MWGRLSQTVIPRSGLTRAPLTKPATTVPSAKYSVVSSFVEVLRVALP